MRERKQPLPPSPDDAVDLPPASADPDRGGLTVTFTGDADQVSAGFALALRLLGLGAPWAEPGTDDRTKQDE